MSNQQNLAEGARDLAAAATELADKAAALAATTPMGVQDAGIAAAQHGDGFFINGLIIFVLACFVGYHVVWRVTPALHSPLMSITNAISSVVIVGALLAVGASAVGFSKLMGFLAVVLAAVNIFGGFIVTRRMLHMFKKKA